MKMTDRGTVGEHVRRKRVEAGFIERTAASAINLPVELYLQREDGELPFTAEQLKSLSILFGCKTADFMGDLEP